MGTSTLENEEIKKKIMGTLGLKEADITQKDKDKGMKIFDTFIRRGIPFVNVRIVKTALNFSDSEFADYLV